VFAAAVIRRLKKRHPPGDLLVSPRHQIAQQVRDSRGTIGDHVPGPLQPTFVLLRVPLLVDALEMGLLQDRIRLLDSHGYLLHVETAKKVPRNPHSGRTSDEISLSHSTI
jgi:hypothetical protein